MMLIKEQTQKTNLFFTSPSLTINLNLFENAYFLSDLKIHFSCQFKKKNYNVVNVRKFSKLLYYKVNVKI